MAVDTIDLTGVSSDSSNGSASEAETSRVYSGPSGKKSNQAIVIDSGSGSSRRSSIDGSQCNDKAHTRAPPPNRSSASALSQLESQASLSLHPSLSPELQNGTALETARPSGLGVSNRFSQPVTPPSSSHFSRARQATNPTTPKLETPKKQSWTVRKIEESLSTFKHEVANGHAELTAYIIDSTKPEERRILSGSDLFAEIHKNPVLEKKDETMRVKFKQHYKSSRKDHKEEHYQVMCIKTGKERVPRYRFHHVEIKKNIMTPFTMLMFVPHFKDIDFSEEDRYNVWLQELEEIDLKSGFKPLSHDQKLVLTRRWEQAGMVSLYLEKWLERLAIPGCTKSKLIRYVTNKKPDTANTPQQKTDIIRSHQEGDNPASPPTDKVSELFSEAFHNVFQKDRGVDLRDVLHREESVESNDSKPTAKDGSGPQKEEEDDVAEFNLGTYCILGCLLCFSHSCEHSEYDIENNKLAISMVPHLSVALKQRRRRLIASGAGHLSNGDVADEPCRRLCHRTKTLDETEKQPWDNEERIVLRSVMSTIKVSSKVIKDPFCLVANILDRNCCDVFHEYNQLGISEPQPEPQSTPPAKSRTKSLPWYDRFKKTLMADWQDQTLAHEHQRRELHDSCTHDGPCTAANCVCVKKGNLCDKFCGCSVESCAYKFTGCACHSQGKNCYSKQKEKSCICIQLHRECDPELCGSCGVLERADRDNAEDEVLHSTGCQNCDLQRGRQKGLVLGQSQLEGVGYGLFAAEKIAQDDFIIEYVGEIVTHDEGVRRETRRGDVFDRDSSNSYLFTLLEKEGIWVDAAIFGNLSRYINHASESEKRGCNITPQILYVNGEYRIKFTAIRDIKVGEELFFNYGEYFTGLTKKLLDTAEGKGNRPKKRGRKPQRLDYSDVARKAPKANKKRSGRAKGMMAERALDSGEDAAMEDWAEEEVTKPSRKRKRGQHGDSDEEEYQPTGTNTDATASRGNSQSTVDSDEPFGESTSRFPKRARAQQRGDESVSPSKARNQPKTRGKRGGARPGSGRPRKHPRPTPKTTSETEADVEATSATASASASTSGLASTPVPSQASAPASSAVGSTAETTSTVHEDAASQAGASPSAPDAEENEDSDDGGDYSMSNPQGEEDEDEDDDQDVVIRKRNHRSTRTRRLPAKFRNDDI